ncbi:MAG: teichoic acid biosynthesis protein [Sandaracinaceae bacterium]|nr:teichoic acid biosynthesis protein [Sandaracinaceae bacterium]
MRILYGVVGEGMGHAMRSRVVLERLFELGHEVEIIASGRAVDFLEKRFGNKSDVNRIRGLHIVYEDNEVQRARTLFENVLGGSLAIPAQIVKYFDLIKDFSPEIVISDFESWTYFYGQAHRLPILSIDNMQILNRCTIPDDVIEGHRADFEISKALVKSKLPFANHYLITTFFFPEIRKDKTTLVKPILRPEILSAKKGKGDHLLVYQTAEGNDELAKTLAETGLECRIYGMRRTIKEEQVEGRLRYRPFSETTFIEDLATAKAVIAGGGFTLMGEAVYLHKPMLSVPVRGQFEQVLNGRYLQKLGYGQYAESLADPREIFSFIEKVPDCARALEGFVQDGNNDLYKELDAQLDRAAAGVYG